MTFLSASNKGDGNTYKKETHPNLYEAHSYIFNFSHTLISGPIDIGVVRDFAQPRPLLQDPPRVAALGRHLAEQLPTPEVVAKDVRIPRLERNLD